MSARSAYRPRTSAANERRDNSGDGNPLSDLIAKLAQVSCNQAQRYGLFVCRAPDLMNIPSPRDHFALNRFRVRIELAVDGACRRGASFRLRQNK